MVKGTWDQAFDNVLGKEEQEGKPVSVKENSWGQAFDNVLGKEVQPTDQMPSIAPVSEDPERGIFPAFQRGARRGVTG